MTNRAQTKRPKPLLTRSRLWTHLALALVTIAGCWLAFIIDPSAIAAEPLSFGLGYVALLYLVVSLLIGPFYLARQRRNPVNLFLRRDVGIWSGITALLHVFFSLQLYEQGQMLLYFFRQVQDSYLPQLDLFGISNYVGLLAAAIILVLLLLSNDWALRLLKGKRWKRVQQWAYPLIVLTILHTLGYQLYNERDGHFIWALVALTVIVALAQGVGVLVHRRRQRQRVANAAGAPRATPAGAAVQSIEPFSASGLSRRRFVILGGGAMLAGLVALLSLDSIEEALRPSVDDLVVPQPPATATTAASLEPAPTATTSSPEGVPTAANPASAPTATNSGPAGSGSPTAIPPTAAPPATVAAPTNTSAATSVVAQPTATTLPATTATPAAAGTSSGVVLTTLVACPPNSALAFTTPDTGAAGILVHEADGSVKAFSNVCTHRPYPLQYDADSQLLVCPLHLACFNAQSGRVTRGPARRTLPTINVHVDDQGNIIYG